MATLDEEQQARSTYVAPAPGFSLDASTPVGTPAQPAPPAEDAPADSSTAVETQPSVSEQAPPLTSPPETESWNLPPKERWEARQQELERERAARIAAERQAQLLAETIQRVAPQPQTPLPVNPWAGLVDHPDPATAQFYQQQQRLMEHMRFTAKQEAIAELQPVIQAGMQKLAAIDTKAFRQDNPDIKAGSEEEALVIAYMEGRVDGVRHPIESARNNAVIKRLEAENRALKTQHARTPQKRAAATSEASAGMPATAGLPQRTGSWREQANAILQQGGSIRDVANDIFNGG